jgi:hypothetical protein
MIPLENDLERLLDMICREWGFCLPRDKRQAITTRARLDAREFATAVLRSEGFLQPEYEVVWMRRLSQRFEQHFGTAAVSASETSN